MAKKRKIPWEQYAANWYQGAYSCYKCGEVKFTKGTRKDKLICKTCYQLT